MSYCLDLGFSLETAFSSPTPYVPELNIGAILEIFSFGKSKKLEYQQIVSIIGEITRTFDINITACLSKIHRVASNDKKKRGEHRNVYRLENFTIPTEPATVSFMPPTEVVSKSEMVNENLKTKLDERRKKVAELTEKNKQFKRKLERRNMKLRGNECVGEKKES